MPRDEPRILSRDEARPPAVIGFFFSMTPPTGWTANWTNNVQSGGKRLTQEVTTSSGGGLLFFKIDPCDLTSLDTPGTQFAVSYEFVFTLSQANGHQYKPTPSKGSLILRLDRDTVAPMINTLSAPSTAYRDQTIQVAMAATDVSDEIGEKLVWDSGLRAFTLDVNPDSSGLQTKQVDESVPQTCGEKVKKERHDFSYTIPHSAQPGDIITLHAEAVDWSGNVRSRETTVKIVEQPKTGTPFPPRAGCKDVRGSVIHYQGIGGKCTGTLIICAESFPAACNPNWFNRPSAIAGSEKGPKVCCDDWRKARQSKKPCDVSLDADCDGIPNNRDRAPSYQGDQPPPQQAEPESFFRP